MVNQIEVLLREHVENVGRCGDVVKVAPGYARNFLMPRRLAVPATEENRKQLARRAARMATQEIERLGEISARMEALSQLQIATTQKADEAGRLYGSVNAAAITELCVAAGTAVEEKDVRLDEGPLKVVGEHKARIHVHGDHFAEITVVISAEGLTEQNT